MRILVAAPSDPYSLTNFVEQFRDFGHEVTHWDFTAEPEFGIATSERYDLLFHVLVNNELSTDSLADLKRLGIVSKALMWASDDSWRLPVSLAHVGDYDYGTTNTPDSIPIYRAKGHSHVRHVQYGVNPKAWVRPNSKQIIENVTFVGQAYVGRPEFLAELDRRGVRVAAYGAGFPNGGLPQDDMLDLLGGSKIVLGLNWVAGGPEAGKGPQIKGRLFEMAAMGVFQLVNANSHLSRYFADDEIATFSDIDDCVAKIRYYLDRSEERNAIAKRGQERVLRDHTWKTRWAWLWKELGEM